MLKAMKQYCYCLISARFVRLALCSAVVGFCCGLSAGAASLGSLTDIPEPPPPADSTRGDSLVPISRFTFADNPRATLYGDRARAETRLDPTRSVIVGAAYLGAFTWLHLTMKNAWWESSSSFKLKNDWDDVLQVDKAGHFFAAYTESYAFSEGLMAAGVGWDAATTWGTALGLLYQSYVEIEDGFSDGWGFSPSDMGANILGCGFFLGQHYIPALQNFTPKYLYVPPSWIDVPSISTTWIDNYNSSSFWLGINVSNLLSIPSSSVWPSWLQVAVGYGVNIESESVRSRRFIIALDYDLVKLLPSGGHVWNWLRQTLNFIKLPAPAIEFSPRPRFRLLFPF